MRALMYAPLLIGLSACEMDEAGATPQGQGTTRTYAIEAFEKVELAGGDDVDIRVGPGFSVRAEGPTEVLDQLRIDRDGDMLEIGRRNGVAVPGKARVIVTMPAINGASLAGSGTMRIDKASAQEMGVEIAGSGSLMLGQVAAERLEVEIAGSGTLRAAGTARTLDVDIAGSGNVEADGLLASAAEVSIAGSGDVRARVNGDAKVKIMGSGDVDLGANARCEVDKMGSGSVRCASQ